MAEKKYFNRELSWIAFNRRVLEEAQDLTIPLLERLKFLSITSSNFDEFFMVRVGGLRLLLRQGIVKPDRAGLLPKQQLEAVRNEAIAFIRDQYECYNNSLEPMLAEKGITRTRPDQLNRNQAQFLEQFMVDEILPVISPMAVGTGAMFPLLPNLLNLLAVRLKPEKEGGKQRYAIVPLVKNLSRFITVPSETGYQFILLEDVLSLYIGKLFDQQEVVETVPFRLTRNADMAVNEDAASDLLAQMEKVLEARKDSENVRLEVREGASKTMLAFLQDQTQTSEESTYHIPGPLNLGDFMRISELENYPKLQNEKWEPQPTLALDPNSNIFDLLGKQDILLYHPCDSYEPVLKLLEDAASDPDVLAIKQTLYRTSRTSRVVAALRKAAANGKYVTAVVELKARFDEARNIDWARKLEQDGLQVIYGVKGLKTHSKITVIVRREARGIVKYMHFGTGNYNESTARLYCDVSYMTSNEDFGSDATAFFNAITGYSQPKAFLKLDASPFGIRDRLLSLIEGETERKSHGQKAFIMAQINSLADPQLIDALYKASQAGVKIQMNVRGVCCLKPGMKGVSENIKVTSIVDRYLEHARIFLFNAGGDQKVYISSADWMMRNMDKRVELLVPVDDPASKIKLIRILEAHFEDNVKARRLNEDGTYSRVRPGGKKPDRRCQEVLFREAEVKVKEREKAKQITLEPHRSPREET
jgi:polyphosphate kinase